MFATTKVTDGTTLKDGLVTLKRVERFLSEVSDVHVLVLGELLYTSQYVILDNATMTKSNTVTTMLP